jgi:hypothetical protein
MSQPSLSAEMEVYRENIITENNKELEEIFVNELEYGGVPITKDNFEELYEKWLEDLTVMDLEALLE